MIVYADTGFLVSLYGRDNNSDAAVGLARSRPVFVLTSLGDIEFANAIELRVFRKEWTHREARMVRDQFLQHQAAGVFQVETLTADIWERAIRLSRLYTAKLGTRTLDIVHVASALVLKAEVLFTFDERQKRLAAAVRLRVMP